MFHFSIQLGMSSSQLLLTPSFFRGVGQPPTRNHGGLRITSQHKNHGVPVKCPVTEKTMFPIFPYSIEQCSNPCWLIIGDIMGYIYIYLYIYILPNIFGIIVIQ